MNIIKKDSKFKKRIKLLNALKRYYKTNNLNPLNLSEKSIEELDEFLKDTEVKII